MILSVPSVSSVVNSQLCIDLVYTLGTGSKWQDNELRYSLRSVEKNLKGYRNIFIVGHKPAFVTNVIHIPARDISDNADANMAHKTLIACSDVRVSDLFLYIHDDHFIIQPVKISDIGYYYKSRLEVTSRAFNPRHRLYRSLYSRRLRNTYRFLKQRGLPTYNFDGHYPILINKNEFRRIFLPLDYFNQLFVVKSIYANSNGIHEQAAFLKDCKFTVPKSFVELETELKDRWVFSIADRALQGGNIQQFLAQAFPDKSKWEI